jgi:hypothetical protein
MTAVTGGGTVGGRSHQLGGERSTGGGGASQARAAAWATRLRQQCGRREGDTDQARAVA